MAIDTKSDSTDHFVKSTVELIGPQGYYSKADSTSVAQRVTRVVSQTTPISMPFRSVNGSKFRNHSAFEASRKYTTYKHGLRIKSTTSGTGQFKQTRKDTTYDVLPASANLTNGLTTSLIPDSGNDGSLLDGWIIKNDVHMPLGLNMINRLKTVTTARLRNSDINLGVTAGEFVENRNLLVMRLKPVLQALIAIKRGNISHALRLLGFTLKNAKRYTNLRTWADLYVEYRFGWDMLFSDIHELYKHTTRKYDKSRIVKVTNGMPLGIDDSKSGSTTLYDWTLEATQVNRCSIWALCTNENAQQLSRLGLIDPASVVWEVIPFSFVIDWFVPIGKFIEASSARHGLTFLTGSISCVTTSVKTITEKASTNPDIKILEPRVIVEEKETYRRYPFFSFPIPALYLNDAFGKPKREDIAAALAVQQVSNLLNKVRR